VINVPERIGLRWLERGYAVVADGEPEPTPPTPRPAPPRPSSLRPPVPFDEEINAMGHFIHNRQPLAPVPSGKGITRQQFTVAETKVAEDATEDKRTILDVDVAFDPATGEAITAPEYWAEVGTTVERTLTYWHGDVASPPTSAISVQVDNYDAPLAPPTPLVEPEQIDEETDVLDRPTI
jgi:hypothetical protein